MTVWIPSPGCTCPWNYCGETTADNQPPDPCSFGHRPTTPTPREDAVAEATARLRSMIASGDYIAQGYVNTLDDTITSLRSEVARVRSIAIMLSGQSPHAFSTTGEWSEWTRKLGAELLALTQARKEVE